MMKTSDELTKELLNVIPKKELERVISKEICDIDCSFLGFIEPYWHLSHLIPRDWTIFDFGCAYNTQCYFFDKHNAYHAIEPLTSMGDCKEMFHTDNTIIHRCTTGEFLKFRFPKLDVDINRCFAIVNNVPNWYGEDSMKLVRETFKNCYTFYIA